MNPDFVHRLDQLREVCGFPFIITSGFRDPSHPVEAAKEVPGTHSQGIAVDIKVNNGFQRRKLVQEALKMGFNGIGVAKSFVHIDDRDSTAVLWAY
jgi:uncharacterized protein YcbK (DUF882 family)